MTLNFLIKPFKPQEDGSLPISRFWCHIFESKNIKRVLGINLALMIIAMSFFGSTSAAFNQEEAVLSTPQANVQTTTSFKIPVEGFITQNYSWYHPALDIAGNFDKPIYPIADGKVREVEYGRWGYGHKVVIDHEGGYASLYAHLGNVNVKAGDTVTKDTVIGNVGVTGWTTGPHLHIEVYSGDKTINPAEVLPAIPVRLDLAEVANK